MPGAVLQPFPTLAGSRAQVWSYSPRYRRPRHFHSDPELNLVVAGTATFGVGNGLKKLGVGELIAFTPGQEHELVEGSPDLVLFAIGLRPSLAVDVLRSTGDRILSPFHARLSRDGVRSLERRCSDASARAGADGAVAELWQAALWVTKAPHVGACFRPHTLTRRVLSALEEAPELDRTELARAARSCPSEISRHFQRDLGMTLVGYRVRRRLLTFIGRVDAGASQTAAALDAGFGSYSQCYRAFFATFAVTPRDFFQTDLRHRVADTFVPAAPERA